MINVYWLEQTSADVPVDHNWLSAGEILRLNGMQFRKRRTDWQLGRWTAKNAVASHLWRFGPERSLAEIEILSAPSGAPGILCANQPMEMMISLSHRDNVAVCALSSSVTSLGCDLETIEPHSDGFIRDYFTVEERRSIVDTGAPADLLSSLFWSAKESALKALRIGLRIDTRSVVVDLKQETFAADSWHALRVRLKGGKVFSGWWKQDGTLVRTVVADAAFSPPITLHIPSESAQTQAIRLAQSSAIP
jgi:4'-phosphopantetheinyl transferase